MKEDIRNLSFEQIEGWLGSVNQPKYRAEQIFRWLYQNTIVSFREMKNLPKEILQKLEEDFSIFLPVIKQKNVSKSDGTTKYLLKLSDGELIEAVVIPAGRRITACLSTQAGCRYRCRFCASGMYGYKRDMTQSEILSQLIIAKKDGYKITNIVFMGTGEPLDNLKNVIGAINIINDKKGFNIGARRITVSTSGIPDKIKEFAKLGLQIELSISLHAADNNKRDILMPINKLYPLKDVIKAVKEYYKRIATFEYVVIKDTNDKREDADKLAMLLKDIRCKVNLIPYSPVSELPYKRPDKKTILQFEKILMDSGIPATIRQSKGLDIDGACGQLRIRTLASDAGR